MGGAQDTFVSLLISLFPFTQHKLLCLFYTMEAYTSFKMSDHLRHISVSYFHFPFPLLSPLLFIAVHMSEYK